MPLGTYKPHGKNKVYLRIENGELIIEKTPGVSIAIHPLSKGMGQLIKKQNHSRDKTKGIKAYMETVKESFGNEKQIEVFLQEINKRYPRYIRDQLQIVQKTVKEYNQFVQQALDICIKQGLWSANDLRDVAIHLEKLNESKNQSILDEITVSGVPSVLMQEKASIRELDGYLKILGGV